MRPLDHPTRDGIPAGKVLAGGLAGFALAAALNSQALLRDAERKPFGTARDVSVAIWEPVEAVSSAIGLHLPRLWADEALGRDVGGTSVTVTVEAADSTDPDATTDAAAAETDDGPLVPTAADPLSLQVAGDSMVQFFGSTLVDVAEDTGVIDATTEHILSSGLTRPDFFDWPSRLAEIVSEDDPDALVVMFGGNDAQGIVTPSGVAEPFEDAWVTEYAARVGAVMDLLARDRARVVLWVGQPIMDRDDFDDKMQQLNAIYAEQAQSRDHVTFVPTRELFQNADGNYARFLPDEDGELTDMRLTDRIHLSTAGGLRLSQTLVDVLGTLVPLDGAGDPAGEPTGGSEG